MVAPSATFPGDHSGFLYELVGPQEAVSGRSCFSPCGFNQIRSSRPLVARTRSTDSHAFQE